MLNENNYLNTFFEFQGKKEQLDFLKSFCLLAVPMISKNQF